MVQKSQRRSIRWIKRSKLVLKLWVKKYKLQQSRAREREEKSSYALTLTSSTMPKICATTVIIELAKARWLIVVVTQIDLTTQGACARTATSQSTTSRERMPSSRSLLKREWRLHNKLMPRNKLKKWHRNLKMIFYQKSTMFLSSPQSDEPQTFSKSVKLTTRVFKEFYIKRTY